MSRNINSLSKLRLRLLVIVPLLIVGLFYFLFSSAYGALLPQRSLLLSNDETSASVNYQLGFNLPASETLGSIKLQICANDPLFVDPCVAPAGFNIAAATLSAQSGETGFAILPSGTNANTVVLTRAPSATAATSVVYTFGNVVNPSSEGSYYGRLQTFASSDASGAENDHGGLSFSINSPVQISTTVPPYLLFCAGVTISGYDCTTASGSYVNFGNLTSAATSSADTQMITATNAANGFTMRVYGTTMTSGNNVINAMAVPDVSRPGVSQFGLNLVANATPQVGQDPQGAGSAAPTIGYNQPDWFKFGSGDAILSAPTADDYKKLTASYILNIPTGQPVGVYATTLTYVCLANF